MNSVAKLVSNVGVASVVLGVFAIACSNTPQPEQAVIASNVQPNPASGAGCSSPEKFIYIPEAASIPGPDTSNGVVQCTQTTTCQTPQVCCLAKGATAPSCVAGASACSLDGDTTITNSTATGGDVEVSCSIIPSGSGYNVTLVGKITGGVAPGTLTVTGLFTPRPRDGSTNKPNADQATKIPNITVDLLDATKHLNEKDCFAQYLAVDNGSPSAQTALPDPADVYANDNGGRIWVSIFCPTMTNELESQKPGNAGCMASTTLRFENCASKAQ